MNQIDANLLNVKKKFEFFEANVMKKNNEQSTNLPKKMHIKLPLIIVFVLAIITFRLYQVALEHNDWRGFYVSLFHIFVVGVGTGLLLRAKQ